MGEAYITRRGGGAPLNFKVVGGVGAVAIDAGTVLGTIYGRTYTKTNAGKAVWAFVHNGQYTGPMLVSPDGNACSYSTSGDYVDAIIARDTVTYNGKTYYYSAGSWMGGAVPSGLSPFIEKSEVDAALMLAKTYEAIENPKENTIWVNTNTAITGWHFGAEEPNVYDIKTHAEDPHQYYAPHVLSSGDILNFVIPQTCTAFDWVRINGIDGKTYAIRYADGSLFTSWNAGVKVGVLISNEKTVMGGAEVFLAKLLTYGSFYHEEGTVWLQTGTTSLVAMNALKKNSIQVCPLTAKQYVGGAWALKDAETYQGGKWNDWAYWIIGNGANGLDITGGFTSNYENQWSFADDGSLTFYKDIDNMYSSFNVPSKRTFDVTNYNSMTIKVSSFSRNASYIGVNAPSNLGKDSTCRVKISAAGTYTLDISAISGEVHLQADLDYNGVTMVVSELYFS